MADSDKINQKPAAGSTKPAEQTTGNSSAPAQNIPPQPAPTPTPVIDQAKLMEMLHQIETLRKNDEEKSREIERLKYAADKARVARFDSTEASKKSLIPTCKVSLWDGKIQLAWRLKENEAFFNNGVYHENITVEMRLQGDKDATVVSYNDWFKKLEKVEAQIISRTTDADGHTTVTLELADGKQINIGQEFIN